MPLGGGWLGVLAEADEVSAGILAANGIDEITEAEYNRLKKKLPTQERSPVSRQSPQPPPGVLRLAGDAGAAAPLPSVGPEKPAPAAVVADIELQVTDRPPPPEPLLDIEPKKTRRKKS